MFLLPFGCCWGCDGSMDVGDVLLRFGCVGVVRVGGLLGHLQG